MLFVISLRAPVLMRYSQAQKYEGGSVCIFRLAPQDYHRTHLPIDCTIGPSRSMGEEFYTVCVRIAS